MDLLQIFFSNQYIYSPKTFLHFIKPKYKIFVTFSYLCLSIYFKTICFYISISILLLILIFSNIPKKYLYNLLLILITIYIYTFLYKIKQSIYIKSSTSNILSYTFHLLRLPHHILPIFLTRMILIYLIYMVVLNLLKLTTLVEDIIMFFLIIWQNNLHNFLYRCLLIIAFASQALEKIVQRIHYIYISVRIKDINKLYLSKLYYYAVITLLKDIHKDIYITSSILYTREINENNFRIKDF